MRIVLGVLGGHQKTLTRNPVLLCIRYEDIEAYVIRGSQICIIYSNIRVGADMQAMVRRLEN